MGACPQHFACRHPLKPKGDLDYRFLLQMAPAKLALLGRPACSRGRRRYGEVIGLPPYRVAGTPLVTSRRPHPPRARPGLRTPARRHAGVGWMARPGPAGRTTENCAMPLRDGA